MNLAPSVTAAAVIIWYGLSGLAQCSRDFDDQLVEECILPPYIRNQYYSRENGLNTLTVVAASSFERKTVVSIASAIVDTSAMEDTTTSEVCMKMTCNRPSKATRKCQILAENGQTVYDSDMYRLLIKDTTKNCFRCRELAIRTINVLEFRQTECYSADVVESLPLLCRTLRDRLIRYAVPWVTLFSVNPTPVSCRSSIEGVWKFQYHLEQFSGHHCKHPKNNLTSCPDPGNRYSTENRFYISYGACSELSWRKEDPGIVPFRDSSMTFTCLGDWYVGKDHYFAAANLGENRPEEKYRCFIENRDDDQYLGQSLTATCANLKTPRRSPVIIRLERVKPVVINATCYLPKNFTGKWINTAHAAVDSKVEMNATHLIDIRKPDQGVAVLTTYVCQEQKKNRFMMARVGVGGCQVFYVCWHFLPRHHNIIRYRVGIAYAQKDFRLVCSWTSFLQQREWKFDLLIASNPFPVECPIGGKFIFAQAGDIPLQTRVRGGVTKSPRDQVECKEYETDFSVCPQQWYKQYTTKQILIDLDKCMTLDWQAKPIGEYDEPDYILHCIGYWRENARSFW
ncbi:uncharacterized protein LOC129589859 [Paramacrobiotus metropolitanus]|uniref:uncharacterized protein LOC129589859 n=1 Tax=Paramacrobiotus metropolitanus TaxID=2943436 RepID=UPI0024462FCC|nr:uncharacterized protein LOC129589859 [Paramacrobiotus metropolitanus]